MRTYEEIETGGVITVNDNAVVAGPVREILLFGDRKFYVGDSYSYDGAFGTQVAEVRRKHSEHIIVMWFPLLSAEGIYTIHRFDELFSKCDGDAIDGPIVAEKLEAIPIVSEAEVEILYSGATHHGGVVELAKWSEGFVLWFHGEIVWRSLETKDKEPRP